MAALTAAVILLGVLSLFTLVLLLGVVRRLRDHESRLAAVGQFAPTDRDQHDHGSFDVPDLRGRIVGPFTGVTSDGRTVTEASLQGTTSLVGFMSPGCDTCHERLPSFVEAAANFPGPVIAVVVRDGQDTADITRHLPGSMLVLESEEGQGVVRAFGVTGYPTYAVVDESGVVTRAGFTVPAQEGVGR